MAKVSFFPNYLMNQDNQISGQSSRLQAAAPPFEEAEAASLLQTLCRKQFLNLHCSQSLESYAELGVLWDPLT